MDAKESLEAIRKFFTLKFQDFEIIQPNERKVRYIFQKNYTKFGKKLPLSIVVLTPIRIDKNGELEFIPASAKKIALELRVTDTQRVTVAFKGTEIHVGSNWEKILKDKIETFIKLLDGLKQCDGCGDYMTPRTGQRKETGTWFVSMRCRKCSEYKNFPFGTGFKKKISMYLIPKET
jgi:hypothetical protein